MEQHDERVAMRLPANLRRKVERERKQMSREFGTTVKLSAALRVLVLEGLRAREARSNTKAA